MSPSDPHVAAFELARDPDEVPTPLAIAAADFCRRAGRAASPEAVRMALARLDPHEDEELRALVDAEPEVRPLGPEALVDIVRGLTPREAAEREESGYYVALAQAPRTRRPPRSRATSSTPPGPTAAESRERQRQEILSALAEARGDLAGAAERMGLTPDELDARLKRLSLVRRAQQLAKEPGPKGARPPMVRPGGARPERVRPTAPVPPGLPKHGAGRPPKGRLVLGTAAARDPRELEGAAGKAELRDLLRNFKGNRPALLERLNQIFRSSRGPLTPQSLDRLIDRHGLTDEAERLERENLTYLFTQARGDLAVVAQRLKTKPGPLKRELEARGLWDEAERIRDRFRRELFGRPISEQIQNVLLRGKYLREIGAMRDLERQVRREVERHWDAARTAAKNERSEALAKRLNVPEALAAELILRFKLK